MEIIVAKTAGFCFGVNKAVNAVYELIEKSDKQIYTLGSIIHNKQVVSQLKERGVKVITDPDEEDIRGKMVIRAHGVTPEIYNKLEGKELDIIDATCPYVKKIHTLVEEKHKEGYQIIIVGDRSHPEVIGINGWCENTALIVNTREDAEKIQPRQQKVCIVAQTTITKEKWNSINELLDEKFQNIIRYDTICNATSTRQSEAAEIAGQVDMMVVLGGSDSSNTQKLYEICKKYCSNTYTVETSGELPPVDIKKIKKIGITAGASTPDWVIEEVIQKMSELNKQENEMSFKEAFESFDVSIRSGEIVKGRIVGFNNSEVYVDLGFKSDGMIPVDQFSDDPDFKPEKSLKVGDEVEAFVVRVNDGEGNVLLSKKKVDAINSWTKIEEAYENKTPVKAKVVDVVNGGVIATANGARIFIPASQISDRFVKDLNEFLKQTVTVRIIELNKQKKKVVGSQRVILEEEKSKQSEQIWANIEIGKKFNGTVKSLTDFGAFVDIGGVDGLIHVSELSWSKIKHPSEVVKIGDLVEVTILEFNKEKSRISLGFKKAESNPWYNAEEKFAVGNIVKGKVARIVPFGAFVQLEEGIDGLVHISQISNVRIAKPSDVLEIGQEIEAKVIELNLESKKIGLSIKEVNPIDPVKNKEEDTAQQEPAGEEVPSEHKEEMTNRIELPAELMNNENQ